MIPDRRISLLLCLLAITGSLAISILICGAPRPPGQFLKYLDAAARPRLTADRRPDYSPLYLGLVRVLARGDAPEEERANRVILFQCGLLACACGAVTWVLCQTWGIAAGLMGLLLMTTYRPFIVYAAVVEPESLIVSLLAVAILCSALVRVQSQFWWGLIGGSLVLGLCVLLRPTFLPLIPCWAAWVATTDRASGRVWRGVCALGLPLLVVAPAVLRNYRETGSPIFMDPGPAFSRETVPSRQD